MTKIDIPSKNMVKRMVEEEVRKAMSDVYKLLDKIRKENKRENK